VCNSHQERIQFNIASNTQASSTLQLGTHAQHYPSINYVSQVSVPAFRLADLVSQIKDNLPSSWKLANDIRSNWLFVNLDIQGGELDALRSLGSAFDEVGAVYCEVSTEELYVGGGSFAEITELLRQHGFYLVGSRFTSKGWGDALFAKSGYLEKRRLRIFYIFLHDMAWRLRLKAEKLSSWLINRG